MAVMKKVLVVLYMKQGSVKLIFKKIIISKKKVWGKDANIVFFHAINLNLQGKNETQYANFVIGSTLPYQFLLLKSHI